MKYECFLRSPHTNPPRNLLILLGFAVLIVYKSI